jgi:membrane-associated phospholipid phosphatase
MTVETHLATAAPTTGRAERKRFTDVLDAPVLRARHDGLAERLGGAFASLHPAVVFGIALVAGLAVLAALSIGLGVLVTRVVEPSWGIGAADERVNVWLAAHRTSSRTEASLIGSIIAGGVVLPILAGSVALICAAARKWRLAAFSVFALAGEAATYRATTLAVHSHRPRVVRLENLPVNASYPSGHTAAAVALYGGLALLLTSRVANGVVRATAWTSAVLLVAFVAASRMYRGMHHPLDVAGGLVVGVGALGRGDRTFRQEPRGWSVRAAPRPCRGRRR